MVRSTRSAISARTREGKAKPQKKTAPAGCVRRRGSARLGQLLMAAQSVFRLRKVLVGLNPNALGHGHHGLVGGTGRPLSLKTRDAEGSNPSRATPTQFAALTSGDLASRSLA